MKYSIWHKKRRAVWDGENWNITAYDNLNNVEYLIFDPNVIRSKKFPRLEDAIKQVHKFIKCGVNHEDLEIYEVPDITTRVKIIRYER